MKGKYYKYRIEKSDKYYVQYDNSIFGWMYLYDLNKSWIGLLFSTLIFGLISILGSLALIFGDLRDGALYVFCSIIAGSIILFILSRFWKRFSFDNDVSAKLFVQQRVEEKENAKNIKAQKKLEKKFRRENKRTQRKLLKEKRKNKKYFYLDPQTERRDKIRTLDDLIED